VDNVWYSQLGTIREHIWRVESKSGVDYTLVSNGVTRLETMFCNGLDKVNIRVDDLLHVHPSHTTLPSALLAASHPSAGLPLTPEGALAPNNAPAIPESDVHCDLPLLSAVVGLHTASYSSINVHHLGSGQETSLHHPLFPVSFDFECNREAAMNGCSGPRLDAHPQGRHLTNTSRQGYGFAPRLQTQ
jgi:hypothetical protein